MGIGFLRGLPLYLPMGSHDYQYRRRQRRKQERRSFHRRPSPISRVSITNLIVGLVIGIGLALFYAWVLIPVEIDNSTPGALESQFRDDYILLIAETYSVDQDLDVANARLDTLQLSKPTEHVTELAERMIVTGANRNEIRRLVGLAFVLDAVSPPMEPYLP